MNNDIKINNLNSLSDTRSSYTASKSSINNLDLRERDTTSIISREIIKKLYIAQRILSISLSRRSARIVIKFDFSIVSFNALNKYLYSNSSYKSNEKKIICDYLKIDAIYVTFRRK